MFCLYSVLPGHCGISFLNEACVLYERLSIQQPYHISVISDCLTHVLEPSLSHRPAASLNIDNFHDKRNQYVEQYRNF